MQETYAGGSILSAGYYVLPIGEPKNGTRFLAAADLERWNPGAPRWPQIPNDPTEGAEMKTERARYLDALEEAAFIHAGYEPGSADPFTEDDRAEMLSWASDELGYPSEDAPEDDRGLARWWIGVLRAHAEDKG